MPLLGGSAVTFGFTEGVTLRDAIPAPAPAVPAPADPVDDALARENLPDFYHSVQQLNEILANPMSAECSELFDMNTIERKYFSSEQMYRKYYNKYLSAKIACYDARDIDTSRLPKPFPEVPEEGAPDVPDRPANWWDIALDPDRPKPPKPAAPPVLPVAPKPVAPKVDDECNKRYRYVYPSKDYNPYGEKSYTIVMKRCNNERSTDDTRYIEPRDWERFKAIFQRGEALIPNHTPIRGRRIPSPTSERYKLSRPSNDMLIYEDEYKRQYDHLTRRIESVQERINRLVSWGVSSSFIESDRRELSGLINQRDRWARRMRES